MKRFFTPLALVYSCLTVVDHVVLQILAVVSYVLTDGTLIWLSLPMDSQVLLDVALVSTGIMTKAATVGPIGIGDVFHHAASRQARVAVGLALGIVLQLFQNVII